MKSKVPPQYESESDLDVQTENSNDWKKFERLYINYRVQSSYASILGYTARKSIANQPNVAIMKANFEISPRVSQYRALVQKIVNREPLSASEEQISDFPAEEFEFIEEQFVLEKAGIDLDDIDLTPVSYAQELTMRLAFLEGYAADVYRLILERNPKILKSQEKKISYHELINLNSYEAVIRELIDQEIRSSGSNLLEMIRYFKDKRNTDVRLDSYETKSLQESILIRNAIMHNGQRVTSQLSLAFPDSSVCRDQRIVLNSGFMSSVNTVLEFTGMKILLVFAEKYFGRCRSELLDKYEYSEYEKNGYQLSVSPSENLKKGRWIA